MLLGAVLLSACQELPGPYAPPEQRQPFDHFTPYKISRMVDFSQGDANQYIVRDIWGGDGPWRWTRKQPEVRLFMRTNQMLRYAIDFTIVEATFKDTGPVEVSFQVNGHELDRMKCDSQGSRHFEKPVPPEWIEPGKDALVGAEIDKVWYSPADRQALGFILTRIGLLQK